VAKLHEPDRDAGVPSERWQSQRAQAASLSLCLLSAYLGWTTHPKIREALETSERFADGIAGIEEIRNARRESRQVFIDVWQAKANDVARQRKEASAWDEGRIWDAASANREVWAARCYQVSERMDFDMAKRVSGWIRRSAGRYGAAQQNEPEHQCELIRDIFGNPYQAVPAFGSAWRTASVVALAQAIYDSRSFHRMPALADALREAGCTDAAILEHLPGPGPHVRGCWVVDLVLAKE
jgi:hypothetical protein